MHDELAMAHDHPKAQSRLHQMTQYLVALDSLTTTLYQTQVTTTLRSTVEILIPRTPQARRILNQACAQ